MSQPRALQLPRMPASSPGGQHVGTFVKIPWPPVLELLALAGLDFVVVDAEHAPFDRQDIDMMVLAGRACGMPVAVRVPSDNAAVLLSVLDVGAAAVVVPHVDSAAQAREVVARCRYRGGVRGFSSSPRAAGYGTRKMAQALADGDSAVVICQIESAQAVQEAAAIAQTDGVGALFIGRADLALSMGFDNTAAPQVDEAVAHVIAAAHAAGKTVAMAVGGAAERERYAAMGASWFVVGSDQSFLRQGAAQATAASATSPRGTVPG
jgi:2-keto-3-deoxy-L-rhamnonate aldolase RhmA